MYHFAFSYLHTLFWFYVTLDLKTSLSAVFTNRAVDKGKKEERAVRRGGKEVGRKSLTSRFSLFVVFLKMVIEEGLNFRAWSLFYLLSSLCLHFSGVISKYFLLS